MTNQNSLKTIAKVGVTLAAVAVAVWGCIKIKKGEDVVVII